MIFDMSRSMSPTASSERPFGFAAPPLPGALLPSIFVGTTAREKREEDTGVTKKGKKEREDHRQQKEKKEEGQKMLNPPPTADQSGDPYKREENV